MHKVKNREPVHAPALFPAQGRLINDPQAAMAHYAEQMAERNLHISLFFDGTKHNQTYDTRQVRVPCPTNVARLYHASLDQPASGYFSYYVPGVGAPFPEIGELDFNTLGMAFGNRGEDRINWGLLQIANALAVTLTGAGFSSKTLQARLKAMATTWPLTGLGQRNRRQAMVALLEPLRAEVATAQPLAIKLFVYGFSRGAAQARTFVNWLSELFDTPKGAVRPEQCLLGIPLHIEFLGLLDTVASVGTSRAAPFAEGHMAWADGTQALPDAGRFPDWIKVCRHYVAAHEQRLSFPLDSIRYRNGRYPAYAREVIYPGMHSDVGGGYAPGDQGKARGGQGELLSQIALHDLYAAAFAAGAPLQSQRQLSAETQQEFAVSADLIARFNAWRSGLTLTDALTDDAGADQAVRLDHSLEDAMTAQLAWITGWRIERFARGSYANQPFYGQAIQTNASQQEVQKAERKDQSDAIRERQSQARGQPDEMQALLAVVSPPPYQPVIDQQQMREAAVEFEHDYQGWSRDQTSPAGWVADVLLRDTVNLLNDDDERHEYAQIRAAGERCARTLFFDRKGSLQCTLLIALFDDQVHDSRAWFLHDALSSRELWGDYFRYRMVYFGDRSNKPLTPVVMAKRAVGISLVLGASAAVAGTLT